MMDAITTFFLLFIFLIISPLAVAGLVWVIRKWLRRRREKQNFQRAIRSGIRSIDQMDGHQLEYFLVQLFKELGYRSVKETKRSNDFGADLVVKKEKKMVVQVTKTRII